VKSHGKTWVGIVVFASAATLLAGCGGIQAQRSVSPASFFVPGFMKLESKPGHPAIFPEPGQQVALKQ
jgi:hypothetical protein